MGGGGPKGPSKGGSAGQASNADLQDDEDLMARKLNRRVVFDKWKSKRRPNRMIDYINSPKPIVKSH